ncbi:hypothetical protein [Streptomyces halstedii]|uniref:hypothetical protein n=1 Tax=Streptomyces halstedii TaxID=1944 RepID=UPI00382B7596
MSAEEFSNSLYERAFEPADEVVLPRPIIETHGLQPEDLGVLAALILRDPGRPATAKSMAADLRSLGWKMSVDRFQAVSGRLTKAGHLYRESVFNDATGRPETVTRIYRNPANNPGYVRDGILASRQAGPGIGKNPTGIGENPVPRGQGGIGENPIADPGSGFPRSRKSPVPQGQNRDRVFPGAVLPPPYPPEGGGGTPPPNPRTKGRAPKADRYAEQCALTADDYQPTVEEIRNADAFLQDLPGKWQMGPDEARALAPLLASRAHTQGYELDTFLELVLVQDDADKPATRPSRVMPYRVRNLKRRRIEDKPLPGALAASGGLAEWCGVCNVGERPAAAYQRTRELPDGRDVPCPECHPKFTRA